MAETVEMNRYFYLGEDVDSVSVKEIIKGIREINRHDDKKEKEVVDYKREPIEIIVSTFGGSVYDGFGLIDAMNLSKTPVHTVGMGKMMSMGFAILIAGHHRSVTPMATAMYHQLSAGVWNDLTKIKRDAAEWTRLQDMYNNFVVKRTSILLEKLEDVIEKRMDWFISAEDCKKLGIVDEVLGA